MIISPPESDQMIVRNASPRMIIGEAYGIRLHDLITGLPGWADSEAYDMEAKISAAGADMPALLHVLQLQVGRPVIDRTGLTGHYNFILKWTPDQDSASPDAKPLASSPQEAQSKDLPYSPYPINLPTFYPIHQRS
jgi:hypothetical protein